MNKNNKLLKEKQLYLETEIPEQLDIMIEKALKDAKTKNKTKFNTPIFSKRLIATAASVAVLMGITTILANTNQAFAQSLAKVPVVGNIIQVITFKEYKLVDDNYNANIQIPQIENLQNKELESLLNEKYLMENKILYEQFMQEILELEAAGGGHMGIDSGYVVKTDNERILAIGSYVENTVGSSSTIFKYDTIDKQKEILITLPSLFKNDSYIEVISENIKSQMIANYQADKNNIYWVEGVGTTDENNITDMFNRISKIQNFYINDEFKLVISFDKYEVAPGYMGVIEFVIPSEVVKNILVSDEYIK